MVEKLVSGPAMTPNKEGPDPVYGVGLVLLGLLVMGFAGAATFHYLFNIGTGISLLGAAWFLVAVVVSSFRGRGD